MCKFETLSGDVGQSWEGNDSLRRPLSERYRTYKTQPCTRSSYFAYSAWYKQLGPMVGYISRTRINMEG